MSPRPCPHCGAVIRQSRSDGRCVGCGKLLPEQLRAPPEPAARPAENVGLMRAAPAFSAHYDRAMAHLKKREYEQAIAEYTEAIRLDPKAPNSYLGRALAYRSVGDEANAVRDERAAQDLGGAEQSTWDRLVNRAYQRWKGELSHMSRGEFYQWIHPLQRKAVLLRELNNQVFNGGFPQWVLNGYGAWINELVDAVKQVGTDAAREVRVILEGVSLLANTEDSRTEENEDNLAGLLEYTDRYYNVMSRFGEDVETWLEEQSQLQPEQT
jgi:tetratricopeptide (TPR) repeat protein